MSEAPIIGIAEIPKAEESKSQDIDLVSEDEEEDDVVDVSQLSWPGYFVHMTCLGGKRTLAVVDGMGEWLADFFGITGPKYWYIIDEYERQKAREEKDRNAGLQDESQQLEGGLGETET